MLVGILEEVSQSSFSLIFILFRVICNLICRKNRKVSENFNWSFFSDPLPPKVRFRRRLTDFWLEANIKITFLWLYFDWGMFYISVLTWVLYLDPQDLEKQDSGLMVLRLVILFSFRLVYQITIPIIWLRKMGHRLYRQLDFLTLIEDWGTWPLKTL